MKTDKKQTETRLVYGFLDAGKTTYISDCVKTDPFYKKGSVLILCFERGVAKYDEETLREKNAAVVYYSGGDVKTFCEDAISTYGPDRIYVELNTMKQDLKEQLPECMKISFVITLIDWSTMPVYYTNMLQMMKKMVEESHQVTFRGCPSGELLEQYSQSFRAMNPKASFLRQDPMGYHERAFGLSLPFSLEGDEIEIGEKDYIPFWLDALENPAHYDGKTIRFIGPVEIRKNETNGMWTCGRVVMTCCMADLQFMSVELEGDMEKYKGWAVIVAEGTLASDGYGLKKLRLRNVSVSAVQPPEELIIDGRVQ